MIRSVEFALTLLGGIAIGAAWRSVASPSCSSCPRADPTSAHADAIVAEAHEPTAGHPIADLAPQGAPGRVETSSADGRRQSRLWSLVDEAQGQEAALAAKEPRTGTRAALDARLTRSHLMWPLDRVIERYGQPTAVELGELMRIDFDRTGKAARPSRVSFALQEGLVCAVEAR